MRFNLDRHIVISTQDVTNTDGSTSVTYTEYSTCWAKFEYMDGNTVDETDKRTTINQINAYVRFDSNITPGMVFWESNDSTTIYTIVSKGEAGGRRQYLKLESETRY